MSPVLKALHTRSYTAADLHRRLRVMHEVLEKVLYDEPQGQLRVMPAGKRREQCLKIVADGRDAAALEHLPEELWDGFTPATLTSKLKQLIDESEALPVMTLYVPVPFSDTQLAPISSWARAEVDPGLMFDVIVKPRVVGGCAFVYKDKHFDWSLRRYLRSKRGMITSLLNSYGE